jgi:hypothetical protein
VQKRDGVFTHEQEGVAGVPVGEWGVEAEGVQG